MKTTLIAAAALLLAPAFAQAQSPKAPKTEEQKTLYALGLWMAREVSAFNLTPEELAYVHLGLKDKVMGKTAQVPLDVYGPKINELARARHKAQAVVEKKRSSAFLEKAAQEPGALKTATGLIYFELQAGSGDSPKADDTVQTVYKGTLVDGTEFDSSALHGSGPMEISLDKVIPCWTEGIQRMKVGGKSKLVCPAETAYGERGQTDIPGGAALVFEIELRAIAKK